MPPVRVPIPPYLLKTSWAAKSLPPRYLRAVLQLPLELRPIALRSFYSIAHRAQLQQIASNAAQYNISLHGVNTSHAFQYRQDREHGNELDNGKVDGVEKGIAIFDEHERAGGPEGIGTVEEATDSALSWGNGTPSRHEANGNSKVPKNSAPHIPTSLFLTPPRGDIPDEMRRLVDDFLQRNPSTETDIYLTYNEYRNAITPTEFGFIAKRFPNFPSPIYSRYLTIRTKPLASKQPVEDSLLFRILRDTSRIELSSDQKDILETWCRIFAQPILKWHSLLAKINAAGFIHYHEVQGIAERAFQDPFPTTESISQAYRAFRKELLATERGNIFKDFPSQVRTADFTHFSALRSNMDAKLAPLDTAIRVADGAAVPALAAQYFHHKVRLAGLLVLLKFFGQYWGLGLDERAVDAYGRLRATVGESQWSEHVGPNTLKQLTSTRTRFRNILKHLQTAPDTAEKRENQDRLRKKLAALDEFFQIVENSSSVGSTHGGHEAACSPTPTWSVRRTNVPPQSLPVLRIKQHNAKSSAMSPKPSQAQDGDALCQRIAALRSKLFDTHRDRSRDILEDEVRRVEQSFLESSSKASSTDDVATYRQVLVGQTSGVAAANFSATDTYQSQTGVAGSPNISTYTASKPTSSGPKWSMKNTYKREVARERSLGMGKAQSPPLQLSSSWSPGTLDRAEAAEILPESSEPIIPHSISNIVAPTSPNQPSSDSTAISELKSQVAELKDLIRGLIFQQISRPSTSPLPSLPVLTPLETTKLTSDESRSQPAVGRTVSAPLYSVAARKENTQAPTGSASSVSPLRKSWQTSQTSETHTKFSSLTESELAASVPMNLANKAPRSTQSLLEELFPEETKNVSVQEVEKNPSAPARIPVPHVPLTPNEEAGVTQRHATKQNPKRRHTQKGTPLTNASTVLELRYASKSLTEDDFRRLIPRGRHMQEWTQRGEIVKVFPRRDPWTLEKTGNYYIIFSKDEDARAYREHVHHVHDLARQHTPTSLTSAIEPPPGYIINGEDVSALVQSFSLIPPQQKLFLQYLSTPFTPIQQNLFQRGGYAQILSEGREGVAQVLVEFLEGRQPSYFEISDAIHVDGKRRGLEWKLLPGESSIRKVDMNNPAKKDEDLGGEDGVDDALSELAGPGTVDGGKRKKTVQERAKTPTYGQRWILSFKSVEEAKRFAIGWHQRPFPWHSRALKKWQEKGFGEQVLMVRAELLW